MKSSVVSFVAAIAAMFLVSSTDAAKPDPTIGETCTDNAITAVAGVEAFAPGAEITTICLRDRQLYRLGFWVPCPNQPDEMTSLIVEAANAPNSCRITRARTSGACSFIPVPAHSVVHLTERREAAQGRRALARFCREFDKG